MKLILLRCHAYVHLSNMLDKIRVALGKPFPTRAPSWALSRSVTIFLSFCRKSFEDEKAKKATDPVAWTDK